MTKASQWWPSKTNKENKAKTSKKEREKVEKYREAITNFSLSMKMDEEDVFT